MKNPCENVKNLFNEFELLYGENNVYQQNRYFTTFEKFKNSFGYKQAFVASSSGRVELCGNHTDHNGGKVLACGISLDTLAFFMKNDENVIKIKSEGYRDIIVDVLGPEIEPSSTSNALVRGVVVGLKNRGYKVGGFSACITSNVLGGAGISSSASFEVLICEILNFLYNDGLVDDSTKALISQFAEREYFKKPCGLLDQTAIAYGGLKKMDFKTDGKILVENVDNQLKDFTLVLINTGGSHANLTSEYASIPNEMFSVAKFFNKNKLIEVDEKVFYDNLPSLTKSVNDRAILRAIHFFEENKRVDKICNALTNNDYETFLSCIKKSGISSMIKLQNCYVSGSVDQPIPKALSVCEKFLNDGANRVHGGGFAGTILNVVKNNELEYFIKNVSKIFGVDNVLPLKVRKIGTSVL